MTKKIICIDFDGVIHSYISGWKGADIIPDPPVKGAIDWLGLLYEMEDFEPMIYSSRSKEPGGVDAMRAWLRDHTFEYWDIIGFPTQKPPAWLTIDDRCICFKGTFPSIIEMRCFRPWTGGFLNEIMNSIDDADEEEHAEKKEHVPLKEDERLADKPGVTKYEWLSCQVTFMQNMEHEGYDVEVADNDGIVVKTHVYLYEWSGYVTPFINAKDVTGMVEYLIELNRMERRDGTIIREE